MYNNDSNSLNTGAPDIRLTGNQDPNQQMASATDPMADMDDLSRRIYGKGIKELTPRELDDLENYIREKYGSRAPQQDSGIMASAPGTYTQQRKQMMAGGGIAGLKQIGKPGGLVEPGISKYGMFDFITEPLGKLKDKIVDDLIPNELKNPAALATMAGLGLNQFGLPDVLTQKMGMGSDVGQNWLGDLLGTVTPGDTQFNTVFGDKLPFMYNETLSNNPMFGGIESLGDAEKKAQEMAQGDYRNIFETGAILDKPYTDRIMDIAKRTQQDDRNIIQKGLDMAKSGYDKFTGTLGNVFSDTERDGQKFNWKIPVAAGLAAGAYTASQPRDTLPMDQTGINFQTARQAMDDPNLRFKPKLEDTQLAAEGGRIGYNSGGLTEYQLFKLKELGYRNAGSNPDSYGGIGVLKDILKVNKYAQGGRIRAEEGGLMNLGGMEKDYRQEGGFVPIGGKEKADDVPARLSKNEFVFTADAVRGAGGGDIDQGAEIMENMMKHLEAGGEVSEDSQGLEGARGMFANAQQLEKRII